MDALLKAQIIEMGKKMLASQMVVGTWGNISVRIGGEKIIITPSGLDYGQLIPEDLPLVSIATGEKLEGELKPSSELPLHLAIYQARQDVGAIIHTHSIFGSCCAVLRQSIPPLTEDMAMVIGGGIDVAEYFLPGTSELAQAVVQALGVKNSVLLANHGVVGVGANLEDAFKAALLTEKTAQIFLTAKSIGNPYILSKADVDLMHRHYLTVYSREGGEK